MATLVASSLFLDDPNNPRTVGNHFTLKGDDQRIPVDLGHFRDNIRLLRDHVSAKIQDLHPALRTAINEVSRDSQLLYETAAYTAIFQEINGLYYDVGPTAPGTVGAFFAGCRDGPCSESCVNALQPPQGTWQPCREVVLDHHPDHGFRHLNDVKTAASTTTGTVYSSIGYFTNEEKAHLQRLGLQQVKVVTRAPGSMQKQHETEYLRVNDLPGKKGIYGSSNSAGQSGQGIYGSSNSASQSGQGAYVDAYAPPQTGNYPPQSGYYPPQSGNYNSPNGTYPQQTTTYGQNGTYTGTGGDVGTGTGWGYWGIIGAVILIIILLLIFCGMWWFYQ
jgi:hypothetical protein